jgi:CHAD domain-containing protein
VRAKGAEIVHDTVAVLDHQRVTRSFEELEVELLDGDEKTLRRIEKALRRAGAADGESRPKVFQALDLDFAAEPVDEPEDASSAGTLRVRIREQAEHVLAHDPGTRLGTDSEELHQMRVATRRLRAFLRAGRELLDPQWSGRVREELKLLGGALGPVRDLDVLIEHLTPEIESLGDDRGHGRKLMRTLERNRRTARGKLIAALRSDRYFALLDTLEQPFGTSADGPTLKEIHAAEHRRLRQGVQTLDAASPDEELHAARIKVKRARYAAELSGNRGYVKAAKALQDVLGRHQDAVVAAERLRDLARRMPDIVLAAGRLVECEYARGARARDEWRSAWKQLAKTA